MDPFFLILALILNSMMAIESCSPTPKPPIPRKHSLRKARVTPSPKTTTTTRPTTTTAPSKTNQTLAKYAKYTRHGFYIEIEEATDNVTKIYQMKQLPPIYSQTMDKPAEPSNKYNEQSDSNIEQIIEPGSPSIQSQVGDSSLTQEDLDVNKDWKGECYAQHWKYCNSVKRIIVMGVYNKTDGRSYQRMDLDMDCTVQEITCMSNGWTVNRCQIICMSKCNRDMLQGYDNFVQSRGACKYI